MRILKGEGTTKTAVCQTVDRKCQMTLANHPKTRRGNHHQIEPGATFFRTVTDGLY
jgi:hypothetical protein